MRWREAIVVVVLSRAAWADDEEPSVSSGTEAEHPELEPPPELKYGFSVRPRIEHVTTEESTFELTPGVRFRISGTWASADREVRLREDDLLGHDWTAEVGASIDLGFAQLDGRFSYGHAENELGDGDYTELGLALTRMFKLDDNLLGFISLSFARRHWRDTPFPGEQDASTVMLMFGLRW